MQCDNRHTATIAIRIHFWILEDVTLWLYVNQCVNVTITDYSLFAQKSEYWRFCGWFCTVCGHLFPRPDMIERLNDWQRIWNLLKLKRIDTLKVKFRKFVRDKIFLFTFLKSFNARQLLTRSKLMQVETLGKTYNLQHLSLSSHKPRPPHDNETFHRHEMETSYSCSYSSSSSMSRSRSARATSEVVI